MAYPYQECIRTNKILDVQRTRISADVVDLPITLDQAKAWLKMDGITDDDEIIQTIISEAFDWIEEYCGVSIVPSNVVAVIEVKNRAELPYGPVTDVTSVNEDADISGLCLYPATGFVNVATPGRFTVGYTAGYTVIPAALLGAVYGYISYAYEHRGDDFDENSNEFATVACKKAFPFSRNIGF